ncbi:MAG: hypothetical protein ACHQUC_00975 [Chlamydiales bacterium]
MKNDLERAKNVLRAFLADIEAVKGLRKNVSLPLPALSFVIEDRMPVFDGSEFTPTPDSYWEKEDAYIWLYADAWNFRSLMHRPKPNPIPEYYSQSAGPLYQQWRKELKEVFHRKCEQIPPPADGVTLAAYLQLLALTVMDENEHRDVWVESLRCFLQFLREDTELEQKGLLEMLFPSKESCKGMEFRKNHLLRHDGEKIEKVECRSISRKIEDTVYPIDILAASEILMHLSTVVLEGRPNAQRSAAEALGFAWLCHAVGCYRLMTRENLVFSTELDSFRPLDLSKPKEFFKPTYFIGITSLFGVIDVPVSKTLYEFLLALPRDPGSSHIFSMDWETVLRAFRNKGVKQSVRAQHLGQITFLTFMSQPHEAIGHRPSLIQKSSKP